MRENEIYKSERKRKVKKEENEISMGKKTEYG